MLIATVEDVLRVCATDVGIIPTFWCSAEDSFAALFRLQKRGLLDDEFSVTPRGHEYIRRAKTGWVS